MAQGSELLSSFVARKVMLWAFKLDVTAIGLDEMREYPELGKLGLACIPNYLLTELT